MAIQVIIRKEKILENNSVLPQEMQRTAAKDDCIMWVNSRSTFAENIIFNY